MIKAVIFDLDGTLLNTLEDLADSVNYALKVQNNPVRTLEEVRNFIGNGVVDLILKAVPTGSGEEVANECFELFFPYYLEHIAVKTHPYDGVMPMLQALKQKDIKLGVISNKVHQATLELINRYFNGYFDFVTGKQKALQKKPHSDLMLLALESLGISPKQALYVGDSDVDIVFAKNAQVHCISVTWGFGDRQMLIDNNAETLANSPQEIVKIVENIINRQKNYQN